MLGAGPEHTCADDFCWGRNSEEQLGDGTKLDRNSPTQLKAALRERLTAADAAWSWVLLRTGSWAVRPAEDGYEAMAVGSVPHVGRPCAPHTPCAEWLVSSAAFGDTLCAQLAGYGGQDASRVFCSQHQDLLERDLTGDGDPGAPGPALTSFYSISLGDRFACAVRLDRRIECWGDLSGLRADGNRARSTWVSGIWNAISVVTGSSYGCFKRSDEHVQCFGTEAAMGLRRTGMAPNASASELSVAAFGVKKPFRAYELAAGAHHACAWSSLTAASFCWGKNDQGQLGNGTLQDSVSPIEVP
jgi:Regulator of chromosome condensation (RCC1) repeat